jgi:hypothetical protein
MRAALISDLDGNNLDPSKSSCGVSMFRKNRLMAFIATRDGARAREFYETILGLRVVSDTRTSASLSGITGGLQLWALTCRMFPTKRRKVTATVEVCQDIIVAIPRLFPPTEVS